MLAPVATVPMTAAEMATTFAAVTNPESVSVVSGSGGEIGVVGGGTEVDESLG